MDPELYPSRKPAPKGGTTDEPSLWDQPKPADDIAKRQEANRARKEEVRRLVERSVPVAQRLAALAKYHGIAPVDLRPALKDAKVITGEEGDRSLSWLCQVWKAAGLPKKWPEERRYDPKSGNYGIVHVAPEYLRPGSPEATRKTA